MMMLQKSAMVDLEVLLRNSEEYNILTGITVIWKIETDIRA